MGGGVAGARPRHGGHHGGINVPANNWLKAAGDVDAIDVVAARAEFDEGRRTRWNLVRVVLSMVAFAALLWALVLAGRLG